MTGYAPIAGTPPAIQWLDVDVMQVDDSYQRATDARSSQRHIAAIAANWDWRLCPPLLVSHRDGGFFVIDGQHRLAAARLRGDLPHLPACVFQFGSAADEAHLFVWSNRVRRRVGVVDNFRAALAAGDPQCAVIDQLVRDAGLKIARHAPGEALEPGAVGNVNGMLKELRKSGRRYVSAALTVMGEHFARQVIPAPGVLFDGLVALFKKADESFDPDQLVDAMAAMTAAEWCGHPDLEGVTGGPHRAEAMRRAILDEIRAGADA